MLTNMKLNDVDTYVSDGLLGFTTEKGTGVFVKIGASPVEAESPVIITGNMGVDKIKARLGLSPLADSTMDSVENGANRIYCIPVKASVAGVAGTIKKEGEGTGNMTVDGSPYNSYSVTVQITGKGGHNSALFKYSIDGGYSFSDEETLPLTGEFEIPETGMTLGFTEAASDKEESFQIDDAYTFSTTAPQMTNADALAAIDALRHFEELFEFVHIVGESTPAMWSAVSEMQLYLEESYKKPLLFIMEAGNIRKGETVDDYAFRLEAEKKGLKNYAVAVVSARSLYVKMDGTTREINNAGVICGLLARVGVQKAIGRTADTAKMGIKKKKMIELRPHGIEEYTWLLDNAQYITFREYQGLEDFFVYNARVMGRDGSDYRYIEDVRVLHKIIRETRKEALQHIQDDIDVTDTQGELETKAKLLETPLDEMVRFKEISDFEITVPEGQDIIMTETFKIVLRYVSRGYIRKIEIDVGRANINIMAA